MSGEDILSTEEPMAEPMVEESTAEPTMEETPAEPATVEPVVHIRGDFLYTKLSDGTFSICGYNGKTSEDEKLISVEIPASIDGVTVTQIGEKAFAKNEIVETIILPESILSIAKDAFAECRNLKGIAFRGENPESVSTIIQGCNEMEKIFILADKDFTVFQKQMAEDLGEETVKYVEVLEDEDLDKLETAYKEYVDSLRKSPFEEMSEVETAEECETGEEPAIQKEAVPTPDEAEEEMAVLPQEQTISEVPDESGENDTETAESTTEENRGADSIWSARSDGSGFG